ncbi:hypothetical protein L1887_14525 [Cichorium endivia]|nr:hypothetical protein L1887_14525 [Cichorium endivia]
MVDNPSTMESESNLIPILESKWYFIAAEKDLVEARTDMIHTIADVQTSSMKAHEGSDEIIVDQNPYNAAIPTVFDDARTDLRSESEEHTGGGSRLR